MRQLDWLRELRLTAITRRQYDWVFGFSDDASLVVACLWRLLRDHRIRLTSLDDDQRFGLTSPIDAERQINEHLADARIVAADTCVGTLDLQITFDNGYVLQIIPDSSGYEAWALDGRGRQFIAVGGGELAVLGSGEQDPA